ncbi:hypothetical protein ACFCX4_22080 [Kitasatospora sp. NPDC056327]|uniref:hypothetical protein n=1 Tax=Kitasatospora sp. NPDC056327 TaxID=3345785 RepID=UPI0035DA804C
MGHAPSRSGGRRRSYGIDVRTTGPAASRVSFTAENLTRFSGAGLRAHARIRAPEEFDSCARTECRPS